MVMDAERTVLKAKKPSITAALSSASVVAAHEAVRGSAILCAQTLK